MDSRAQSIHAVGLPFALLGGAFRLLGWLNGGAALGLTAFVLGVVGGDVAAPDLQLPLRLLLAGLLAACLGGLCAYLAQVSMLRQSDNGRWTRAHLPAQSLVMLCYAVSALAFCAGCWLAAGQGMLDAAPQMTVHARCG